MEYDHNMDKDGKQMNERVWKLKKELEARRKKRQQRKMTHHTAQKIRDDGRPVWHLGHDEEREGALYSYEPGSAAPFQKSKTKPFFNKDTFIMQLLASVCFFLVVGVLMQTSSQALDGARQFVRHSFQQEFQFDRVAVWYEDLFGRPLALVPFQMDTVAPGDMEDLNEQYALPASGTIRESFQQNGRGIFVETAAEEAVEAVQSGIVRHVGQDEENEWGQVVVISHYDGSESWYGMLDNINVSLYDHIDGGDTLAHVSSPEGRTDVGIYYFALKEGDAFVDPADAISLD